MSVTLDFQKQPASGFIKMTFSLPNAFSNWKSPTATELNNGLDISKAVSWQDLDFGIQASNTTSDPSIADEGNVETRGASQFGGNISFYHPHDYDDITNLYSNVYDAVSAPRTHGYITVRVDGNKPSSQAWAEGDLFRQYEVLSDSQSDAITGEEAFRYTINWLQQGNLYVSGVVRATTNTVVIPATLAPTAGAVGRLTGTLNGREYTNGLVWSTSDPDVITIVGNSGVYEVTGSSADTATITATDPATGVTDTTAVTVA